MAYEGWTNWETWHTSLLINNEYDLYQIEQKLLKENASFEEFKKKLKSAEDRTRKYHKEQWPKDKFEKVNWGEIYKNHKRDYALEGS